MYSFFLINSSGLQKIIGYSFHSSILHFYNCQFQKQCLSKSKFERVRGCYLKKNIHKNRKGLQKYLGRMGSKTKFAHSFHISISDEFLMKF